MPPDGNFGAPHQPFQAKSFTPSNFQGATYANAQPRRDAFAPLDIPQAKPPEPDSPPEDDGAQHDGEAPDKDTAETAAPQLFGLAAKLAKAMTNLTAVIAQETALLQSRQPREAQALHGSKARMIFEYKDIITKLKTNQDSLGEKGSNVRMFLRGLGEKLKATLKDHARVVIRLKSLSEGLIKSVGEEVAKKSRPTVNYGKSARMVAPSAGLPPSLALNELI